MRNFLNIGCGKITHHFYENIDIEPIDRLAKKVNIIGRLPYNDSEFEFCYSSHLLEHLSKKHALDFLIEVKRVLRDGGICRIVVPDLERIVVSYLEVLSELKDGKTTNEYKYDWLLIEMFDQLIRVKSGGEMYHLIINSDKQLLEYISNRLGLEILEIKKDPLQLNNSALKIFKKIKFLILNTPDLLVYLIIFMIKGRNSANNYRISEFRSKGEIHKWMYDSFSLCRLMTNVGFKNVKSFSYTESYSDKFILNNLDTYNGFQRKRDSIYIEGIN